MSEATGAGTDPTRMVRFEVKLPYSERAWLDAYAREKGCSRADIIRFALQSYRLRGLPRHGTERR